MEACSVPLPLVLELLCTIAEEGLLLPESRWSIGLLALAEDVALPGVAVISLASAISDFFLETFAEGCLEVGDQPPDIEPV